MEQRLKTTILHHLNFLMTLEIPINSTDSKMECIGPQPCGRHVFTGAPSSTMDEVYTYTTDPKPLQLVPCFSLYAHFASFGHLTCKNLHLVKKCSSTGMHNQNLMCSMTCKGKIRTSIGMLELGMTRTIRQLKNEVMFQNEMQISMTFILFLFRKHHMTLWI